MTHKALRISRTGRQSKITKLTPCPAPLRYNCRRGSCNPSKLVTLSFSGRAPRHRTGKLQDVASLATSVNIFSICACTWLCTRRDSSPERLLLSPLAPPPPPFPPPALLYDPLRLLRCVRIDPFLSDPWIELRSVRSSRWLWLATDLQCGTMNTD